MGIEGKNPSQEHRWWTPLAAWLLGGLMRLIFFSSQKEFVAAHHLTRFFDQNQPLILAAWHRHNIQSPYCYLAHRALDRQLWAITSASKDGSLAAMSLKNVGVNSVRGSSSKGGTAALRKMLRLIREGSDLAFTPDGPRGPRYQIADGVLVAARLSGAPIVPIAFDARHKKVLKTWDRLILPRPFTRLRFTYGKPIFVPRSADTAEMERLRSCLFEELMRISRLAAEIDPYPDRHHLHSRS